MRSARLMRTACTTPLLAAMLAAGMLGPASATAVEPATDSAAATPTTDAIPQEPVDDEPTVPNAVTVVTRTADGGLAVNEVSAPDPGLATRSLNSRPGVVASTVKRRQILAAPNSDGSARDLQWPLNQLGAEDAWKASTGAGVVVAVLDTGVDAGHPDLVGRVLPGYDAIKRRAGGTTDPNGHGTHVAGSIAGAGAISGIAPDSMILPVRVMNSRGNGNTGDIVSGIVWSVNRGASVINLSLGSRAADRAEEAAVRWARGRGVIVVAAVGNDGGTKALYPAAYGDHKRNASQGRDPVIGVGATHRTGERARFSQRGNAVDVAAPGVRVLSTVPRAKGSYAWESGTSMSAPLVAGTAALLIARIASQAPQIQPVDRAAMAISAIRGSTRGSGSAGINKHYGSGSVDAARALAVVGAPAQPGMSADARLIGGARGLAVASFTTPAGTSVHARLTSADGGQGAPAAANVNSGTALWSGAGGRQIVTSIPGLSTTSSYTLTVFTTRGGVTSRTVTGLRPVKLKVQYPKSMTAASKKKLRVRAVVGPGIGVPGAKFAIDFRFTNGKRKTIRTSPMTSRPGAVPIPSGAGPVYFTARADAGDGNWPFAANERVIRRRG